MKQLTQKQLVALTVVGFAGSVVFHYAISIEALELASVLVSVLAGIGYVHDIVEHDVIRG